MTEHFNKYRCHQEPNSQTKCDRSTFGPSSTNVFMSISSGLNSRGSIFATDTQLDRFIIKRLVGRGSLGDVYLARDIFREQDVAIKVVNANSKCAVQQFQRERFAYDRIQDHRHILKVHDIHPVHFGGVELLILSMENADGGTFRKWLQNHQYDLQARRLDGLEFFKQICRAVMAIHEVGLCHLDIKPENCLCVGGIWKVADFHTTAAALQNSDSAESKREEILIDHNFGTPQYMSPAHFTVSHPSELDARADIYSLGIMLYELLHPQATLPFGGDYQRLRELHTQVPVPPLPNVDEFTCYIVNRCLEKHPDKRYQAVELLLNDLEEQNDRPNSNPADEITLDMETMWQEALQLVDNLQFNQARQLCKSILKIYPDFTDAGDLLTEVQQRYEQAEKLYGMIEHSIDRVSLEELCRLLAAAVEAYPDHPSGMTAQILLENKSSRYGQAMQETVMAICQRDVELAQFWLDKAKQLNNGAVEVEKPAGLVARTLDEIRQTRALIDQAIEAGDSALALDLAHSLDVYLDDLITKISFPEGDHET